MSITISTVPFLVLIAILYLRAQKQLFPVLMFTTIFQGAALVIIGSGTSGLSLAPAQIVLGLLIIQKMMRRPERTNSALQAQTNVTTCLFLYASYALLTAIFCPFFFEGISVSNPRSGMGAPLSWGMYNVTQSTYLLLGIAVYWLCVYRSSLSEIKRSLDWYLAGSTFAALLAMYQYIAFNTGLPFPSEIIHSNTQHTIFEAYDLGGFTRVNSTFTEAAAAAGCFSTALALVLWRVLFVECNRKLIVCLISLLTGLILTRSTTGYVALAFIAVMVALLYLRKTVVTPKVRLFRNCLALGVFVIGAAAFLLPEVRSGINDLLDKVLFTKTKSSSYEERTAWNNAALAAASNSHWIGAGWGSLRASSLIANILGTVGIPGLLLFASFCTLNIRYATKAPSDSTQMQKTAILPILVSLLACVLAGPEMTDPVVWFMFGVAAFSIPRSHLRLPVLERAGMGPVIRTRPPETTSLAFPH